MSRIAMNMPNTMAMKAMSRRGSMRSTTVDAAEIALAPRENVEGVVGASAMPCPIHRCLTRCDPAVGDGTRLGVDAGHYRQARPQHSLARDVCRHGDPDGYPLYDLGEVAGRVVRR